MVFPNGRVVLKDQELLDQRVDEGRFTAEEARWVHNYGDELLARLNSGERWWPEHWRDWSPDPEWQVPSELPAGWENAPFTTN